MKVLAVLIAIIVFLATPPAFAANKFVTPGGAGSQNGNDWNNAYSSSWTPARENVYYLADGSYGSQTFDTANSGSTTIEIRKCTTTDGVSSAVAGYVSTLCDGQATFGTITLHTGYWILNGVTRNENDWHEQVYGFRATSVVANSVVNGDAAHYSTIQYIDLGGTYSDTYYSGMEEALYLVYNQHDILVSHCFMHNSVMTIAQLYGGTNITIEYSWVGPGWGKEAIRGAGDSSGMVIRFNKFWNAAKKDPEDETSGLTAEIGLWSFDSTVTGVEIYGNTFVNSDTASGRNAIIIVGGDGSGWVGSPANGTLVYNNTFAGIGEASVFGHVLLNGTSTEGKNNLFYLSNGSSISASTTSNNVAATVDPFVGYSTLASHNLHIVSGSQAHDVGVNLGSSYNTDMDGVTRGSGGIWDVGAYEYDSGGDSTAPVVSISNTDPSNVTSDTLAIFGTAEDTVGVTSCKWLIGAAPTSSTGTAVDACTGCIGTSISWSDTGATGFTTVGSSYTLYVGCTDAAGNWGSDSITVTRGNPAALGCTIRGSYPN